MQLAPTSKHSVMGITTLEKIIEFILSTAILDEKDFEKKQRSQGGLYDNHYSMTMINES